MNAGWMLLLVLAVVGASAVGRQLHRYPGGRRFAFGREYSAARHDLDTARNALRGLERAAQKELSGARAAARKAEATQRRRVRSAEADVGYLREPGRGPYVAEIPGLSLYQHVLVADIPDEWPGDLPLDRIAIRADHSPTASHIYLTGPDGRQYLLTYPVHELGEEYVRKFVVDVRNAIPAARTFQRDRPRLIREAEAELRRVGNDTTGPSEAGLRLDALTARQNGDPRIPRARQDLDGAHARWHALTGRLPR
ncbi:hypothetical protein P8A22_23280 [Streptomyces laculatispora]|uniref:Secreted protein n=1 Tax=Streptomyces laculatispora TaxID=887464 RepID=A0ABY9I6U2_9ACTN|nr:hypothetical protein [Streptomyces laculatispora]MBO0918268.1 hypothetical protein [Streptomyces laculatispora]WLQ42607.1 hypothetical protein P8A22_23280 [Streptomyces laculatispora]